MPAATLRSEDLPHPLGPTMHVTAPAEKAWLTGPSWNSDLRYLSTTSRKSKPARCWFVTIAQHDTNTGNVPCANDRRCHA